MRLRPFLLPALVLGLASCGSEPMHTATDDARATAFSLTESDWLAIQEKRILFGHQSVGQDILAGVRTLAEGHPEVRLSIRRPGESGTTDGPGIVEMIVGENGDPASKAADFREALAAGLAGDHGIAMYKHCYLDVGQDTDPVKLFDEYRRSIEAIRAAHSHVTIAHVTIPLTSPDGAVKALLKRVLRKSTAVELNAKRNHFNRLLLEAYAATDPVFDLARLESTRADGSRVSVRRGGQTVYVLAPEYTDDGGHLNRAGQERLATGFIAFLARL